jgi:hypothetical protein
MSKSNKGPGILEAPFVAAGMKMSRKAEFIFFDLKHSPIHNYATCIKYLSFFFPVCDLKCPAIPDCCVNKDGTVLLSFPMKELFLTINTTTMGNLLYVIALILVICWAIGFFAFHAGGIIHVLLVIALISFIFKALNRAA